jgi:hypothetical protein
MGEYRLDSLGSGQGQVAGSCLHDNEHTTEIMADNLNFLDKNRGKVHF